MHSPTTVRKILHTKPSISKIDYSNFRREYSHGADSQKYGEMPKK